jgi:Nucleotidyl transferase AbiEii toxin, Type IV TA system
MQPYTADALPRVLGQRTEEVHVLRPQRTFWEKATFLREVFPSGKRPRRLSRPLYDLIRLQRHGSGQKAIADLGHRQAWSSTRGSFPRGYSAVRLGQRCKGANSERYYRSIYNPEASGYALRTTNWEDSSRLPMKCAKCSSPNRHPLIA